MNQETAELPYWAIPAFPILFVGLWCAVSYLAAHLSGWRRLARHYAATVPTAGVQFQFRGGTVGWFSYRGCLHLAAAPDGLFLWLFRPFGVGYRRLFIPWDDIASTAHKGWMVDWAVMTVAREPGVRIRLNRKLAEGIVAASNGRLRIAAA
ncbi:MAG: hypothetical protein ACKVOI_20295 [Dongiaceae bacterium]